MSNVKKEKTLRLGFWVISAILFVFSCLFMYGFYKSLSGFVANKFEEPFVMLPIISSYLLPVICFLFYFYDHFVGGMSKVVRWVYASLVCVWAIVNLVGIFGNLPLYLSNREWGVYDTIPSLLFGFPFDGLISHFVLLAMQAVGVVSLLSPEGKIAKIKASLRLEKRLSVRVWEYVLLSLIAVFAFVFIGAGVCALNAVENILYDGKFLYLWLWIMVLPIVDLVLLLIKPKKVAVLAAGIALNVVFCALLWIFETVSPGFIIHVGKPLFMIAFSVSIPIEPIVLLLISVASVTALTIRLVRQAIKTKKD